MSIFRSARVRFLAVISPRLSAYLSKRGYSVLPQESVNYASDIINQILTRRRQHLERRNDFIQIMVDHEEAVQQDEEQTDQSAADRAEKKGSQWGTLKKSRMPVLFYSRQLIHISLE